MKTEYIDKAIEEEKDGHKDKMNANRTEGDAETREEKIQRKTQ